MTMTERGIDPLDDLFDAARHTEVSPSDRLMARVLADAAQVQADRLPQKARPQRTGWITDLFGGWPALSGVLAAGVTGLWVGVAPPAGVEDLAANFLGTTQSVTFLPDTTDLIWIEEPTDG